VVLSLWRDNACAGTFRLRADEVPGLIETLSAGLARQWREGRVRPSVKSAEQPPATRA
jgi:hypothetical protein